MNITKFRRKLRQIRRKGEQYKQIKELQDSYAEYWPDKKKRKVSNIMLAAVVSAIVGYAVASFWIQYRTGMPIDSTLTTCWFGFWTTEIIALTTIKNHKTKRGVDDSCE
jgi:hypothetical protein